MSHPAFRFACAAGCAPHAAGRCRAVLAQGVRDAIALADGAAAKLEASPRDAETVRLFRFFFGHDPSRPVPWAGNQQSGLSVAKRFRAASHGFRTRVPHFNCPPAAACVNFNAFVQPGLEPNRISVCPPFWSTPNRHQRGAILLHEMLHLLFRSFFGHQRNPPNPADPQERRRDNSHCYEAFALRVMGHGVDQGDVEACRARGA
jgi:hypothetical protein